MTNLRRDPVIAIVALLFAAACAVAQWQVNPQVGQVNKIGSVAFCVVERHTVDGDVDPRGICPPDADAGVTYTIAGVGVHHNGWCLVQQERKVLPQVLLLNVFFAQIGFGERCRGTGTNGFDFHRHQV